MLKNKISKKEFSLISFNMTKLNKNTLRLNFGYDCFIHAAQITDFKRYFYGYQIQYLQHISINITYFLIQFLKLCLIFFQNNRF